MDEKLAKKKWQTHAKNARRRGLKHLSYKAYLEKIKDAGIDPCQIGIRKGLYQLGRYTDEGDYTTKSCRFITGDENIKDRAINGGTARGAMKRTGLSASEKFMESLRKRMSGTALTNPIRAKMAKTLARPFHFVHESGEVMKGHNFREFCRENGMNGLRKGFGQLASGQRSMYRGWKVGGKDD